MRNKLRDSKFDLATKTDTEIKINFGHYILHDLLEWAYYGKLKSPKFFSSKEEVEIYIRKNEPLMDDRYLKKQVVKTCIICGETFTKPVYAREVCHDCQQAVKFKWRDEKKLNPDADYTKIMEEKIHSKLL